MTDRYAQEMAARDAAQRKEALEREEAERRRVAAVREKFPTVEMGRVDVVRPIADQFVVSATDPAVIPNVPEGPWEVLGRDDTAMKNEGFSLSVPKATVADVEAVIHKAEGMASVAREEGADRAGHRKQSREGKLDTGSGVTATPVADKKEAAAKTIQEESLTRLPAPNRTTETKGAKDAARPNTPNTPQTPSQPAKDNRPKG